MRALARAVLLALLAGGAGAARGDELPGEEYREGTFVRRIRQWMGNGEATITLTARQDDPGSLSVDVSVRHVRRPPRNPSVLERFRFVFDGTRATLSVSGPGLANREPVRDEAFTVDGETGVSTVDLSMTGALDPAEVRFGEPLRAVLHVATPGGGTHTVRIPLFLGDLRRAAAIGEVTSCDECAKILAALLARLDAYRTALDEARGREDELDVSLRRVTEWLANATWFLRASERAVREFEECFAEAEKWEDVIAYLQLLGGLSKLAWHLHRQPKVLAAIGKSPRDLMNLRRLYSAQGKELPAELLAVAGKIDDLRWQAVRKTLDDLHLEPGQDAIFSGSALEKLEALGKGAEAPRWKGLDSDIDVELRGSAAKTREFEEAFTRNLNDLFAAEKLAGIGKAADARLTTFAGNARDLLDQGDLVGYVHRILSRDYLATESALRTPGSQLLARYYGLGEKSPAATRVFFEPLDGAEIVAEMSTRAEIIWKGKSLLDGQTYGWLRKHCERAMIGDAIRRAPAGTFATKEAMDGLVREVRARDLFRGAPAKPDAAWAARWVEESRRLSRELPDPGVPKSAREAAGEVGRRILDAERRGFRAGADLAEDLGEKFPELAEGLKAAEREWMEELAVDDALARAPRNASRRAAAGLLSVLGNPYTTAVKTAASLIMKPGQEDLADARRMMRRAADELAPGGTPARLAAFREALGRALPGELDRIRADMEAAVAGIADEHGPEIELVVVTGIDRLREEWKEIAGRERRMRTIMESYRREELLDRFDAAVAVKELVAEEDRRLDLVRRAAELLERAGDPGAAGDPESRAREYAAVEAELRRIDLARREHPEEWEAKREMVDQYFFLRASLPERLDLPSLEAAIRRDADQLSDDALVPACLNLEDLVDRLRAAPEEPAPVPDGAGD